MKKFTLTQAAVLAAILIVLSLVLPGNSQFWVHFQQAQPTPSLLADGPGPPPVPPSAQPDTPVVADGPGPPPVPPSAQSNSIFAIV